MEARTFDHSGQYTSEKKRPAVGEVVDEKAAEADMRAHSGARYAGEGTVGNYAAKDGCVGFFMNGEEFFTDRPTLPSNRYQRRPDNEGGTYRFGYPIEQAPQQRPAIGYAVVYDTALADMKANADALYRFEPTLRYRFNDRLEVRSEGGDWFNSCNTESFLRNPVGRPDCMWVRLDDACAELEDPAAPPSIDKLRVELAKAVKAYDAERAAHAASKKLHGELLQAEQQRSLFHAQEAASLCQLKHDVRQALGVPDGAGLVEFCNALRYGMVSLAEENHESVNLLERQRIVNGERLELCGLLGIATTVPMSEAPIPTQKVRLMPKIIEATRKLKADLEAANRKAMPESAVSDFTKVFQRLGNILGLEGTFLGAYGYEQIVNAVIELKEDEEEDCAYWHELEALLGLNLPVGEEMPAHVIAAVRELQARGEEIVTAHTHIDLAEIMRLAGSNAADIAQGFLAEAGIKPISVLSTTKKPEAA